jgi:hypothetical protein
MLLAMLAVLLELQSLFIALVLVRIVRNAMALGALEFDEAFL